MFIHIQKKMQSMNHAFLIWCSRSTSAHGCIFLHGHKIVSMVAWVETSCPNNTDKVSCSEGLESLSMTQCLYYSRDGRDVTALAPDKQCDRTV